MASDAPVQASRDGAMAPLAPGALITIGNGPLCVDIAAAAGGRIAQIRYRDVEQLVGYSAQSPAAIGWGSYPMVPWAGRIRRGRFEHEGRRQLLPANLGPHAIHGVGFVMPWRVDEQSSNHVELSLALPSDERWPYGGSAHQRIEIGNQRLRMSLSVTAGERPMPAAIGWHPWFRKPDRLEFQPSGFYPRDEDGIATRPLREPPPGPWDDCFINESPVVLERDEQRLRLTSNCLHWVVYDEAAHATCVEPQSGPPDAFNLEPMVLAPGTSVAAWFLMEWL